MTSTSDDSSDAAGSAGASSEQAVTEQPSGTTTLKTDSDFEIDRPPLPGDSKASRLWRSIWRTHFYAALIATPVLVMLALTGLVILYTEPIQHALSGDLTTVEAGDEAISLDSQLAAANERYPDLTFVAVTPPKEADLSTRFTMADENDSSYEVYVNPYDGEVLGRQKSGDDIVGLANRLHGFFNNETVTIPVPTVAGLLGPDPLFSDAALGDVVIEIFAGWGLILAFTGLYLWWPRKRGTGKALFVPRLGKPGRARWRDLHAVGGTVLGFLLIFFVLTGLPWSAAWGTSWAYAAGEITPNQETSFWEWEGPASAVPVTGDLDRLGHRIPWATGQDEIPASDGGHDHGGGGEAAAAEGEMAAGEMAMGPPADPVDLQLVADAADEEGMLAGYTIYPPADVLDDPEAPFYGSYVVFNPWPSDMGNQGALYLDQFSGETLAKSTPETWGKMQWATEFGIQTHMGTQFGLFTRILMTTGCVLLLWNVGTALVMWNKRRRKGTLGLPRRPVDVRIQRVLGITAVVLAVIYPLWGLSLIFVLLLDRYLIRRRPRLRSAFGMR